MIFFASVGTGYAAKQAEYDISQLQQANAALDLVILMDNSGSMYKNHDGNDKLAYRYDAAAIMLNMCEAQGTKAAVYYLCSQGEPYVNNRNGRQRLFV